MDKLQCVRLRNGSEYLVINLDSLKYLRISSTKMKEIQMHREQLGELISQLDDSPYETLFAPDLGDNLVDIHLLPSYECNYRCTYCYQNKRKSVHDRMTPECVYQIERFYTQYNAIFNSEFRINTVSVTGGEPFLPENRSVIKSITTHWNDKEILFITNGTYINLYKDILIKCKKIRLQVSIDGIKDVHYRQRIPSDPKHYDDMINGVAWALAEGIPVTMACIYEPEYAEYYPAFFDEMEQLGWLKKANFGIGFTLKVSGVGSCSIDENYLEQTLYSFAELKKKDPRTQYVNFVSLMPSLSSFKETIRKASVSATYMPYRCEPLMKPSYAFAPDGTVKVCSCIDNELGIVGRYYPEIEINVQRIKEIQDRQIINLGKCSRCMKRSMCRGGCFATALSKTNEIMGIECGIWENPKFLKYMGEFI